jgi:hypothetical protein
METVERPKSDGSLLRSELLHALLWFGLPMTVWSMYDWWRDRKASPFPLADLVIVVTGDLLAAIVFGLIFFGIIRVMRKRRLKKQT